MNSLIKTFKFEFEFPLLKMTQRFNLNSALGLFVGFAVTLTVAIYCEQIVIDKANKCTRNRIDAWTSVTVLSKTDQTVTLALPDGRNCSAFSMTGFTWDVNASVFVYASKSGECDTSKDGAFCYDELLAFNMVFFGFGGWFGTWAVVTKSVETMCAGWIWCKRQHGPRFGFEPEPTVTVSNEV